MYIGGKQKRPDGGYSISIKSVHGAYIGEASKGNRKDIRNAVEAAHANSTWANKTGHARAQILYFLAENLSAREKEFTDRIQSMLELELSEARKEVALSIKRLYTYAAWADKYDGQVHSTIHRNITLAMPEPQGVMGIVCPDDFPLLGFISTVIPSIAMGNHVIVVPSETHPLSATDFYQVLETSDVPPGTVNIITGSKEELNLLSLQNMMILMHYGTLDLRKEAKMWNIWLPII